jgi:hypothetical protein
VPRLAAISGAAAPTTGSADPVGTQIESICPGTRFAAAQPTTMTKEDNMTMSITSIGDQGLELNVQGKLEDSDYRTFRPLAEDRIREHGSVSLLVRISDFEGWTPSAMWEDLKFDVSHYSDVSRLALVGDEPATRWMARLSKPFTRAEVEHFPKEKLEAARTWVRQSAAA